MTILPIVVSARSSVVPPTAPGVPHGRVDRVHDGVGLRHPRDSRRSAVEAAACGRQLAQRADRVTAGDERPEVRAAPEPLGKHLGPAVEPDGDTAAVEPPAVPRVDDRSAARGNDAPDLRRWVRGAEAADDGPFAGAEARLALVREDLGYPKAGVALDRLVEVDEDRPVARREAPPDGALATPRQADQDDVHLIRPP